MTNLYKSIFVNVFEWVICSPPSFCYGYIINHSYHIEIDLHIIIPQYDYHTIPNIYGTPVIQTLQLTRHLVISNFHPYFLTITHTDVEPPIIACPDNQTAPADPGEVTAVVTWPTVWATDNSQANPFYPGGTHESGSRYPIGVTTVTYYAGDSSLNLGQCSFLVIVEGEI